MQVLGQTSSGRYLRVIYRQRPREILVITAYDLQGKKLAAYRPATTSASAMKAKKDSKVKSDRWDEAKLRRIIDYYDNQSDEDAAKEIETAPLAEEVTLVEVPNELLPQVRKLIARHRKSA